MPCPSEGGRSRPSPATSSATARRSAPAGRTSASLESADRRQRTPFRPFAAYLTALLVDDPHPWASALFDEVVPLGYSSSYVSFARQLRQAGLRPRCEACTGVKGRVTTETDHPSGEDIQWDCAQRRQAPWGGTCHLLRGTLSHRGRTRSVLAESMDQAHLIEALDTVMRRLAGTARVWRTQ